MKVIHADFKSTYQPCRIEQTGGYSLDPIDISYLTNTNYIFVYQELQL